MDPGEVEEPIPLSDLQLELLRKVMGDNKRKGARYKNGACRQVFIHKDDRDKRLPIGEEVTIGVVGGVRFIYVSPNPCVLSYRTVVKYARPCKYNVKEGKSNVILEEDCGTGSVHIYAYPKSVWEELYKLYVKPLSEGKRPFNTGVILMGPPGTGKSRLAKIMARYMGINVYTIDTSILSKWVGESEQRMRKILEEAMSNEPSIIILDDAEWVLMARNLAGEAGDGISHVRMNLQQILFDRMQEIYDSGIKVLLVATSNVKKEMLDPALVRHGRFGPPILVPLPDLEAVEIIIKSILKDKSDEEIKKLAKMAVNAGLSIADTIALAERVKMGGDPKPRTIGGRGYARMYADKVEEFEALEKQYHYPIRALLNRKSNLYIQGPEDVATAFAVQIARIADKTVIKLIDLRYLDEAIHSANMLSSVFIVPTRLDPSIHYYINDSTDIPVIWVGERPPAVNAFRLETTSSIISKLGIEASVKAVAVYRNIDISDKIIAKIKNKARGDTSMAEAILKAIIATSLADETYFEHLISWI